MRLIADLQDEEYPYQGVKETRDIVRAIVLDEEGHFALHHLKGDDIFGHRDYYETPGGGMEKGENFFDALKRECYEELGYQVEIIAEIGEVDDYYNLIQRRNRNHYYLCRRIAPFSGTHFASRGDGYIQETIWVSFEEGAALVEAMKKEPLARLVRARELPIIKEAERILKSLPIRL